MEKHNRFLFQDSARCSERTLFPTNTTNATAQILQSVYDFFKRLEDVGHAAFKSQTPKGTVELLCRSLVPCQIRTAMEERVEYEPALEKNVKSFVKELCDGATVCQKYDQRRTASAVTTATTTKTHAGSYATTEKAATREPPVRLFQSIKNEDLNTSSRIVSCVPRRTRNGILTSMVLSSRINDKKKKQIRQSNGSPGDATPGRISRIIE